MRILSRLISCVAVAAAMTVAIGGPASRVTAHKRESQVTWTTDVEPILKRRCVGCHSTNGFAPISLTTYEDARSWAKAIRQEVLERRMPPWPAARGFGDFANDRSLTPLEVELLTAWADGATPIGPPVDGTKRSEVHLHGVEATRDRFDVVLMAPAARAVTKPVDRVELPTNLAGDRWVTGWELRPGNRSILQQAVLWIVPAPSRVEGPATLVGAWTPPDAPVVYPSGIAQRLPAGSRLALELHYKKFTTPQTDRSGIALRFGARPSRELRHRSLTCGAIAIDRGIDALAVTPRAAEAGATIDIVAHRPDGRIEPLSVVPRYEPSYPITYRFRKNVRLPRGTKIEVRSSLPECSADLEYVANGQR
jgi:hypothetical protein